MDIQHLILPKAMKQKEFLFNLEQKVKQKL